MFYEMPLSQAVKNFKSFQNIFNQQTMYTHNQHDQMQV